MGMCSHSSDCRFLLNPIEVLKKKHCDRKRPILVLKVAIPIWDMCMQHETTDGETAMVTAMAT
eukprot:scaffold155382_cov46-Prasinocladus_malaysianus.AAC.1